jgi:hypothetical protein
MMSNNERQPGVVQAWVVFTRLLVIVVYVQSIFAGVLLSGYAWGRTAHRATAMSLVAGTLLAGVLAIVMLHGIPGGRRFAGLLLALGVGLAIQMTIGLKAADGERILWIHVPLGVALVGMTAGLVAVAQRLGQLENVQS